MQLLIEESRNIFLTNINLLSKFIDLRKSFEQWFHIELFRRLYNSNQYSQLDIEYLYPDSNERCDLRFINKFSHLLSTITVAA